MSVTLTWMRTLSKRGMILLATADTTDMMRIRGVRLSEEKNKTLE